MQRVAILFLFLLIRCNQHEDKQSLPQEALQTNSEAEILNNVIVHQKGGLEIDKAFLSYQDGRLINSKNLVRIGDTVCLNLMIKQGWIAENGLVSIGATLTMIADNGERLFSSPDFFADTPKMVQAKAAQLQLKTALVDLRADVRRFFIQYKVWDKTGTGEVSGRYRLQLASNNPK